MQHVRPRLLLRRRPYAPAARAEEAEPLLLDVSGAPLRGAFTKRFQAFFRLLLNKVINPTTVRAIRDTALLGDPGAMWRVADIEMHVDASADTVDCTVTGLHPPGEDTGYDVTFNDPRF